MDLLRDPDVGAMSLSTDLISILHRCALALFVGVTSVFMLVGIASRLRLRRPRLAWRRQGPVTRWPLGPSFFLLIVAAAFVHAWMTGRVVPVFVLVGYPSGGVFWFLGTWFDRSVVITDCGIVRDIHQLQRSVVWSQVLDYFTRTSGDEVRFVFFYRGQDGERRRLDLPVPRRRVSSFRRFVNRKLSTRFRVSSEDVSEEDELRELDDRIDLS